MSVLSTPVHEARDSEDRREHLSPSVYHSTSPACSGEMADGHCILSTHRRPRTAPPVAGFLGEHLTAINIRGSI